MAGAAFAMTGGQLFGRQASVVVRVEAIEGVAHRSRELLARHHAVAIRVEPAGAFAARIDDADLGAGLDPGRGLILGCGAVQGGQQGDGDDGHEVFSFKFLVRPWTMAGLPGYFRLRINCFSREMVRSICQGM